MNSRRSAVLLVLCVAVLSAAPVVPAAASEDLPDEIAELETGGEGAFMGLEAAPDRDAIIVRTLRSESLRSKLGGGAHLHLAALVERHRIAGANAALRAFVADERMHPAERERWIDALGAVGGVADVSVLGDAIHAFPRAASCALVRIGGPTAVSALRRGGGDAPDDWVLAALARLGDADAFDRVFERIASPSRATNSPTEDTAHRASIASFASGQALGQYPADWARYARLTKWSRRLADPDNDAAQAAAQELAERIRSGHPGSIDDAVKLLTDDAAPVWARAKAALAIGLSGTKQANETLLGQTVSGVPGEVRRYATDALSRVGDLSCVGGLVKTLVHDEDRDRLQAKRTIRVDFVPVDPAIARCLIRRGVRGVGLILIEMMEAEMRTGYHRDAMRAWSELTGGKDFGFEPDASKEERTAAIARMRAWWADHRETLPLATRDDDPGMPALRATIAELIQGLGGFKFLNQMRAKKALVVLAEAATPQLVEALGDANVHTRIGAADTMATADLSVFAAPLAARLAAEQNSAVRTRLAAAIGVVGRSRRGKPTEFDRSSLRAALEDRAVDVRIATALALGSAGEPATDVALLRSARSAPQGQAPSFRAASAFSLARLGDWSGAGDIAAELTCDDALRRADALSAVRSTGRDVSGFSVDGTPAERAAAVAGFLRSVGASVPGGGQK